LEKRAEQVLPESEGLRRKGKGQGDKGERWPKTCMHIRINEQEKECMKVSFPSFFTIKVFMTKDLIL
jgi:hypothetical protein